MKGYGTGTSNNKPLTVHFAGREWCGLRVAYPGGTEQRRDDIHGNGVFQALHVQHGDGSATPGARM